MRRLYVIMGKSGSGKDSVFKELQNRFPKNDCITINTLEGYCLIKKYIENENIEIVPIYIYCSNFNRLFRSLLKEKDNPNPNCSEICRRYLSDEDDFSEDKLNNLNIMDKDKFCNDYTLEEVMLQIILCHPELFDNN